ncbi:putative F-box protein At5g52610 [Silene latifolia]|uniref:putative F-box protein At5g52610 n=1 Tax=Silene latifolia TaxID=37657 RepID=UPI003D78A362
MSGSNINLAKISLNEYIPSDVLFLILAKLPVKTLLKSRCVCKSWCSIIDHPNFIYLQFCNNNKSSGKLLFLERLGGTQNGGCSLTLCETDNLKNIDLIFKSSEEYDIYGTCHSLILINLSPDYMSKGMKLCNPSIRKSLRVPPCPLLPPDEYLPEFVLGFALHSQDYKIITIAIKHIISLAVGELCVAVYTLSDQQWIVRDNVLNIDRSSFENLFGPYYFCEGSAHWLGNAPFGDSSNQFDNLTHLVSLDFDSENFTFLELPVVLDNIYTTSGSLFLLGESLAFFCISPIRLKIWVLKQESGKREWTLWFSGRSSSAGFNLFYYISQRVLYCEGDGGYLVYETKSYNIATCQVREIGKSMSHHDVDVATYFESLALCNKYDTNQSKRELTVMDDAVPAHNTIGFFGGVDPCCPLSSVKEINLPQNLLQELALEIVGVICKITLISVIDYIAKLLDDLRLDVSKFLCTQS